MKQIVLHFKNPPAQTGTNMMVIPASNGQGYIKTLYCESGIRLIVWDYTLNQPTVLKTINPKSCYGFGYCLSGQIEALSSCYRKSFIIQGAQSGFFSFPEVDSYTETVGTERVLRVSIQMDPSFITTLAGKDLEQLPSILKVDKEAAYREVNEITPAMQLALHQMLDCSYQGVSEQLFLEGKMLELIAHKIAQLDARNQGAEQNQKNLTPSEIEGIRHAAELLSHRLEHPPTMTELSGAIGMCRSKFYRCFETVYGITPFEYLHRRRMETAGQLIREGEFNVTQTAYAVGYSSLSHFTKAFKNYFGVIPSKCNKGVSLCSG